MKIGDALLQRAHLEERLDALGSRLAVDCHERQPLTPILKKIETAANRLRDLEIAIAWTFQRVEIQGLTLGTYQIRKKLFEKVADVLEVSNSPETRDRVDHLKDLCLATERLLEDVFWSVDLQVPEIKTDTEEE